MHYTFIGNVKANLSSNHSPTLHTYRGRPLGKKGKNEAEEKKLKRGMEKTGKLHQKWLGGSGWGEIIKMDNIYPCSPRNSMNYCMSHGRSKIDIFLRYQLFQFKKILFIVCHLFSDKNVIVLF